MAEEPKFSSVGKKETKLTKRFGIGEEILYKA
ncbi:MAG: hypothetical protein ACI9XO_003693 [Paraglaciecola sp.]|jgi:hypothetical protein